MMKNIPRISCLAIGIFLFHIVYAQSLTIHFMHNSSVPETADVLKLEALIKQNPNTTWGIDARTSSSGDKQYNKNLSAERGMAILMEMVSLGIQESNISTVYMGEEYANQNKDDPNDRIVLVSYKTLSKQEAIPISAPTLEKYSIDISVWNGLDQKPISGSYTISSKTENFNENFRVDVIEKTSITISSAGFRDSTITINSLTHPYRVELLPNNVVEKLVLQNIYFFPNTPEIIPESFRALDDLYQQLKDRKDVRIEIRGHINWPIYMETNEVLDKQHQLLSEQRALAVMIWLTKKGIPRENLIYKGLSASQMLYPNAVSDGEQAYNRRVEVILLKK